MILNKAGLVASVFLTLIFFTANSGQAADSKKPPQKADFLKTVDSNKDGKASKAEFVAAMEKKFNSMDVDKSEAVSVQELKIYGEKDEQARNKALQSAKQAVNFEKAFSKSGLEKLFTDRAESEFSGLDKNQDGELSADEVGVKKSKKKKNTKAKQVKKPLSKAEFVAIFIEKSAQAFAKFDKNKDGKVTESELGVKPKIKAAPAKSTLPELPAALVKASVSEKKAKRQALIKSFFVGIDANNDGKISSKEKNTVFERLFKRLDTNHDQLITEDEIIAGRHTPLAEQP